MKNRWLSTVMYSVMCLGIVAFIYFQHQLLVQEEATIEVTPAPAVDQEESVIKSHKPSRPTSGAVAFKVDSWNDPLMPVNTQEVKSKPTAAPTPTPAAAVEKPVYEAPSATPILIQ